ncbi:MAG: polyprenyl synthetase family protein [Proteobacteria bacterium]|uniref:Polyprenyl synthetase family protein n=1 Tax=SAR86 cluster bacterium TaxID=2030880 RepID=A0A937IGD2_9GAMM|nr:polyprenyl synthetase family protein [SAR86 cluster bacterium]MBL6820114.1 polyprenyl synthetase family protein [SAR86 cluster bacterium]MDA0344516.1 polyprenyl synthetase family protein [Pseudomonadota bacterium]MDA0900034.1 polyprenyl synthetase family protein [Pseudomonadota bacterium]
MGQSNLSTKTSLNKSNFEKVLIGRVDSMLNTINAHSKIVNEPLRYALKVRGKCVRPILLYLTADALELNYNQFDNFAAALEVLHTYSLVHDDLPCMDDDDLRRGLPTLHKKYNDSTAVLVGDALQTLSFQLIADDQNFSDEIKIKVISLLTKTTGQNGMINGQFLDLYFENNFASQEDIIEMNILKTSLLIETAMDIPLIINGDKEKNWVDLQRIVGLSFQIIDDIIDLTQPTEILGKTAKKDLAAQKKTLPLMIGIDAAKKELNNYKNDALDIISNLRLSNHPLKFYIESLFSRVR